MANSISHASSYYGSPAGLRPPTRKAFGFFDPRTPLRAELVDAIGILLRHTTGVNIVVERNSSTKGQGARALISILRVVYSSIVFHK